MVIPVEWLQIAAHTIPTDFPESDGTLEWDSTTLVLVEVAAGGKTGIGFTYADTATAGLIQDRLAALVVSGDAMAVTESWNAMVAELGGWAASGISRVKMKIGRSPEEDVERVRAARAAIGQDAELFVDANGAYSRKQALAKIYAFAESKVTWFEEPVSSDDLVGLRLLRDRAAPGIDISAGEYGYDLPYFRRMLEAEAIDVLQADATRCAGVTGFMRVGALCDVFQVPLSAHCAPALHLHSCCTVTRVRHLEYFHDHVRIEGMLFDGARVPVQGRLYPDLSRPGLGLKLR